MLTATRHPPAAHAGAQPPEPAAAQAAAGIDLQPPLPRFLQVEPVGRCNLACRMCAVNERTDPVGEMSLAQFRALLDAMPALEQVHLQGLGEPMLHPQFFEMVQAAVHRGLWVSANSNLTLLTEARAERCATSGLAALSVSIDGASAPVYEAIRRKASFAKLLRNLRRLTSARDRHRSPLGVRGVMVLMRSNMAELPALVRLLHAHGVHELLVQRLATEDDPAQLPAAAIPIHQHNAQAELRPSDLPHAAEIFDQAREVATALGLRLHLPRLQAAQAAPLPWQEGGVDSEADVVSSGRSRCSWPWEQAYVTGAGQMLPCCMVGTADRASFGPVFGSALGRVADPLAAWHGPAATAFRQALASPQPPAVCQGCSLYHGRF